MRRFLLLAFILTAIALVFTLGSCEGKEKNNDCEGEGECDCMGDGECGKDNCECVDPYDWNSSNHLPDTETPPQTINRGGVEYTLKINDEFDYNGAPDPALWDYEYGLVRNNELQYFTDEPKNVIVEDGVLRIRALADNPVGVNPGQPGYYSSAHVISKDKWDFHFGVLQARVKIPTDLGVWAGVWGVGSQTEWWPVGGEIDIVEVHRRGNANRNTQLSMFSGWCWKASGGDVWNAQWNSPQGMTMDMWTAARGSTVEKWFSEFHVWEVVWTETTVAIYVDGELRNTQNAQVINAARDTFNLDGLSYFRTTFPDLYADKTDDEIYDALWVEKPFQLPFYLLLQLSIGGNHGGTPDSQNVWPMVFDVDYVRYYAEE